MNKKFFTVEDLIKFCESKKFIIFHQKNLTNQLSFNQFKSFQKQKSKSPTMENFMQKFVYVTLF